ncbi:MAG: ATP-binding protein [Bacillota bacterium]
MRLKAYIKNIAFFNTTFFIILLIFVFIVVFSLFRLLPEHSAAHTDLILLEGWQYRQDDSEQWIDVIFNGKPLESKTDNSIAEYRLLLPDLKGISNPALYFDRVYCEKFEVYVGAEKIYVHEAPISGKQRNYITSRIDYIVPLTYEHSGKLLVTATTSRMSMLGLGRGVYLGNMRELQKLQIRNEFDNLIIGFFLILFGMFILPNLIYIKGIYRKSFLYMSIFVISLGGWNLTQPVTNLLLLYDSREFWINISQLSVIFFMIFFTAFFRIIFNSNKHRYIDFYWRFNLALFTFILVINILSGFSILTNTGVFDNLWKIAVIIDFFIKLSVVIRGAWHGNEDAKIFTIAFTVFAGVGIIELIVLLTTYRIPYFYKWALLIFVASLILITGRRFSETHQKLKENSNLLNEKNITLSNAYEEINRKNIEIEKLNMSLEQKVAERTKELHEAMDKLIEAQEQLVKSERMAAIGSLVAGVAHEINTPVGIGVTAATHLDREARAIDEEYKGKRMKKQNFEGFLEVCRELTDVLLINLRKAAELVKSLKRVSINQSTEEKISFKVKEVIKDTALSIDTELKKGKHNLVINCSDDMEIVSYQGVLSQILSNLMINSLVHGFDGTEHGNITINASAEGNLVLIEYYDNGKGIDAENLPRVFEPFFTTAKSKGSTGLGLNVVFNLVTAKLNGSINCESEPDKGVRFIISFNI